MTEVKRPFPSINDDMAPSSSRIIITSRLSYRYTHTHLLLPRTAINTVTTTVPGANQCIIPEEKDESKEAKISLIVMNSSKYIKSFKIELHDDQSSVEETTLTTGNDACRAVTLTHSMILYPSSVEGNGYCGGDTDGTCVGRLMLQGASEQLVLYFHDYNDDVMSTWRDELNNALTCTLLTDACFTRLYRDPQGLTYLSLDNVEYAIGKALEYFVDESNPNIVFGLELAECTWKVRNALTNMALFSKKQIRTLLESIVSFQMLKMDRDVIKLENGMKYLRDEITEAISCDVNLKVYLRRYDWRSIHDSSGQHCQPLSPIVDCCGRIGTEEIKVDLSDTINCSGIDMSRMDSGHSRKPFPYTFPKKSQNIVSGVALLDHCDSSHPCVENEVEKIVRPTSTNVYNGANVSALSRLLSGSAKNEVPECLTVEVSASTVEVNDNLVPGYLGDPEHKVETNVDELIKTISMPSGDEHAPPQLPSPNDMTSSSTSTTTTEVGSDQSLVTANELQVSDTPNLSNILNLSGSYDIDDDMSEVHDLELRGDNDDAINPSTDALTCEKTAEVGSDQSLVTSNELQVSDTPNLSNILNLSGSYDIDDDMSEVHDLELRGDNDDAINPSTDALTCEKTAQDDVLPKSTNDCVFENLVSEDLNINSSQRSSESCGSTDISHVKNNDITCVVQDSSTNGVKVMKDRNVFSDGNQTDPCTHDDSDLLTSSLLQEIPVFEESLSVNLPSPTLDYCSNSAPEKELFSTPPRSKPAGRSAEDESMFNNDPCSKLETPEPPRNGDTDDIPQASPLLSAVHNKRLKEIMNNISKAGGSTKKQKGKPTIQASTPVPLRQSASSTSGSIPCHSSTTEETRVDMQQHGTSANRPKRTVKKETRKQNKRVPYRSLWGIPCLQIKNVSNDETIEINSERPVDIETEYFKGKILIMMNTCGKLSKYNRHQDHFKGKQRKFEIQIQGQMKSVPEGEIMLGGELLQSMELTFFTKAIIKVLTTFAQKINPSAHFSFGTKRNESGTYELPHLMFPIMKVMDRVVITPPGGEVPSLGVEIKESKEDQKTRKSSTKKFSFEMGYTYTLSIYSMYVDFPTWEVCGIPGVGAKSLSYLIGKQIPNLVCYEISEAKLMESGSAVHNHAHKKYLLRMEMKHESNLSDTDIVAADEDVDVETEVEVDVEVEESFEESACSVAGDSGDIQAVPLAVPSPMHMKQAELLLMGQKKNVEYNKKKKKKLNSIGSQVIDENSARSRSPLPITLETKDDVTTVEPSCNSKCRDFKLNSKEGKFYRRIVVLIIVLFGLLGFTSLATSLVSESSYDDAYYPATNPFSVQNQILNEASKLMRVRWRGFDFNPVINVPANIRLGFDKWDVLRGKQIVIHGEVAHVLHAEWQHVVQRLQVHIDHYQDSLEKSPYWQGFVAQWVLVDDSLSRVLRTVKKDSDAVSEDLFLQIKSAIDNTLLKLEDTGLFMNSSPLWNSEHVVDGSADQIIAVGIVAHEDDERTVGSKSLSDQVITILSKYSGGHMMEHVSEAATQVIHGTGEPLRADRHHETNNDDVSNVHGEPTLNYDEKMYVGDSKDGNRHGHGIYKWENGRQYEGSWKDNMMDGKGYYEWTGKYHYEGDWVAGRRSGTGIQEFADGMRYEGQFKDDRRSGNGMYTWPTGESYSGNWLDDSMHGVGVYKYADGRIYEGRFDYGTQTGDGKVSYPDGSETVAEKNEHMVALTGNTKDPEVTMQVSQLGDHVGDMIAKYSHKVVEQVGDVAHQVLKGTGQPLRTDTKEKQ